ncbi:response regulator [Pollutibacter soli]|uniref:response regulator n=1 Tax=Pollutibacter soli TaxID=3034157 RepID=UPI0030133444
MSRYFKYLLLVAFLAAVLLIVFLQFNSNSNINQLIDSNEMLMQDLATRSDLQQLFNEVITMESKVRGAVIRGVPLDSIEFTSETDTIYKALNRLDSLHDDPSLHSLIEQLSFQVDEKIKFNRAVLDSFSLRGKASAEELINTQMGKKLTDSIRLVILKIDDQHQVFVLNTIRQADDNGRKAKTLGTIMAIIAAIASVFTFVYVAYKVREQQQLISRLNVSEKKARDAARIKENFLANMSHEIRTPLNAILGFTNLLQRKPLEPDTKDYVQTIQKSGENLLTIVNDVLDLSKIEAGMMRIESAPFSLRGLVHSVETMFRQKAQEKNLKISSAVADEIPDALEGDATRLTQILVNIIGNAIKFTSSGSISMHFTSKGKTGPAILLGIEIRDTGIGIAKDQLPHVFERFQQAENTPARKYGGTGLGLSIVKELVELQQGSIAVESEAGMGAGFLLTIPYKIAVEDAQPVPRPDKVASPIFIGQTRLLAVEDNEINQSLLKHLFTGWKLNFDIVNNGREALQILSKNKYDLILMDIQMPEMDGYSTAQEIRNNLQLQTPIVAMTAHAMSGEREKCLSYGMNEYIPKPIREEQLFQIITKFVEAQRKNENGKNPEELRSDHAFRFINLDYMKEVSGGNREYERTVTEQFMEAIPDDLQDIRHAWETNDATLLRQLAHNLKTTISVMGLNPLLEPQLNLLEHHNLSKDQFEKVFGELKSILSHSLQEAKQFYRSFN